MISDHDMRAEHLCPWDGTWRCKLEDREEPDDWKMARGHLGFQNHDSTLQKTLAAGKIRD
jgi:hypothetical protein